MASFTGKIYLTTNTINGKVYIGQTMHNKLNYFGSDVNIKLAIKKYGKENFTKVILIDNILTLESLNCLEDFYIKLYDSTNPLIGYNISPGGRNSSFKHNKSSIKKISIRSLQEDNILRIKTIQKLAVIKRKGTHHKKESKLKMMNTKYDSKRIIEIYKDNILIHTCDFCSEAFIFTKVKMSGIRNNLCGLSKSAGGFSFKYKKII